MDNGRADGALAHIPAPGTNGGDDWRRKGSANSLDLARYACSTNGDGIGFVNGARRAGPVADAYRTRVAAATNSRRPGRWP